MIRIAAFGDWLSRRERQLIAPFVRFGRWFFHGQRGPWRLARWFLSHISPPLQWLWAHRPNRWTLLFLSLLLLNFVIVIRNLTDPWVIGNWFAVVLLIAVEMWGRGNHYQQQQTQFWRESSDWWQTHSIQVMDLARRAADTSERLQEELRRATDGQEEVHNQGDDPRRDPQGNGTPPP